MALFTWCSFFGWQESLFPDEYSAVKYEATSPTLGKRIWFNGKKDVLKEINRIINEGAEKGFSTGQSLYHSIPFFCNARLFAKPLYADLLEEYQIVQDFKIPLAKTLDEAPVIRTRYFNIIRHELLNCQKRQMEMTNG